MVSSRNWLAFKNAVTIDTNSLECFIELSTVVVLVALPGARPLGLPDLTTPKCWHCLCSFSAVYRTNPSSMAAPLMKCWLVVLSGFGCMGNRNHLSIHSPDKVGRRPRRRLRRRRRLAGRVRSFASAGRENPKAVRDVSQLSALGRLCTCGSRHSACASSPARPRDGVETPRHSS